MITSTIKVIILFVILLTLFITGKNRMIAVI